MMEGKGHITLKVVLLGDINRENLKFALSLKLLESAFHHT